mgnify:CR=1 FL=1
MREHQQLREDDQGKWKTQIRKRPQGFAFAPIVGVFNGMFSCSYTHITYYDVDPDIMWVYFL